MKIWDYASQIKLEACGAYCWTRQVSNDNIALLKFRFDFSAMRAAKLGGSCSPSFLPINCKTSIICHMDFKRFNNDEHSTYRMDMRQDQYIYVSWQGITWWILIRCISKCSESFECLWHACPLQWREKGERHLS
jgi:hypothetical protein